MKENFFENPQQEEDHKSRAEFEDIVRKRVQGFQEEFPEFTIEDYYQLYAQYENEQRENLMPREQRHLENIGSLPEKIFDENVHKLIHQRILLEKMNIDPLTGLPDRKKFDEELQKKVRNVNTLASKKNERALEEKSSFGIIYLDIDFFKEVNDTYGHEIGDKSLAHIAHLIKNTLREDDFVARFGGEEFVALVRANDQKECLEVAEKIRSVIETHSLKFERNNKTVSIPMTVSIGVSPLYQPSTQPEKLLKDSDMALYTAKGKDLEEDTYCLASPLPKQSRNQIWYAQENKLYHHIPES